MADTLVLLHAFPLTAEMWRPQVERFSASGWEVVTPELPPGDGGGPSLDAWADAVASSLSGPVVVGGLSMGGYTAFALWRRRRDLVRALVLADTRAEADTDEARANRSTQQSRLRAGEPVLDVVGPVVASLCATPSARETARALASSVTAERVVACLEAMKTRPTSVELLPSIDVPTLVIVGSEDSLTPPAVASSIASAIPSARLVELPGAGHLSSLDQTWAFNEALASFLSGL